MLMKRKEEEGSWDFETLDIFGELDGVQLSVIFLMPADKERSVGGIGVELGVGVGVLVAVGRGVSVGVGVGGDRCNRNGFD